MCGRYYLPHTQETLTYLVDGIEPGEVGVVDGHGAVGHVGDPLIASQTKELKSNSHFRSDFLFFFQKILTLVSILI